jgi:hypothetical protein
MPRGFVGELGHDIESNVLITVTSHVNQNSWPGFSPYFILSKRWPN